DPDTGAPLAATPLAAVPAGAFFSAQCFRASQQHTFTTEGGLPTASYAGNRYGADITNTAPGTLPSCGYQPSELQTAYGLSPLYASGLDGAGQTVVIVDAIGSPTIAADAETFNYFNQINRFAASLGISVNFSSGDSGDSNPSGVTPGVMLHGVGTPADTPWGTAVGGTSLALDSSNHIRFQTAWGTNLTRIVNTQALGSPPIVPPLELGFQFGAGGGRSGFFAKPAFQHALPGTQRLVPDIAFDADPYTG